MFQQACSVKGWIEPLVCERLTDPGQSKIRIKRLSLQEGLSGELIVLVVEV